MELGCFWQKNMYKQRNGRKPIAMHKCCFLHKEDFSFSLVLEIPINSPPLQVLNRKDGDQKFPYQGILKYNKNQEYTTESQRCGFVKTNIM